MNERSSPCSSSAACSFFPSGILGGYVGRIFNEVKHRPLYIVRRTCGLDRGR
jgi:hypothetical protein